MNEWVIEYLPGAIMDNKWVIELHGLLGWRVATEKLFFSEYLPLVDFDLLLMSPRILEECIAAFIKRHRKIELIPRRWRFRNIITDDILPAELL